MTTPPGPTSPGEPREPVDPLEDGDSHGPRGSDGADGLGTDASLTQPSDVDSEQTDIDARFAEIIASFATEQGESRDRRAAPAEPTPPPAPATPTTAAVPPNPPMDVPAHPAPPRSYSLAEEPDEGFTPPRRLSLPADDPAYWAALVGLVGGPVWFLYLLFTGHTGPSIATWAAGAITIAGLAVLWWRLPRRQDVDPDDDGARL